MKTAGIIGGIAPDSTIAYYRFIIDGYRAKRSDGYPSLVINSIDLDRMVALVTSGNHVELVQYLLKELGRLAGAGCDFAIISSNTPHIVFNEVASQSPLPLISIVEVATSAVASMNLRKVALLGTRFTMRAGFYRDALSKRGIELVIPEVDDQELVHKRYMDEFILGNFRDETRREMVGVVQRLMQRERIEAVILAGTELPLSFRATPELPIPLLDTSRLHAEEVVRQLLAE